MKELYVETLPECDFCGEAALYDAPVGGRWGYTCAKCAKRYGVDTTGVGSKFTTQKPEPKFNPFSMEDMLENDEYSARCSKCGYEQEVEPDADYPCPECGVGRLRSPLIVMGMI